MEKLKFILVDDSKIDLIINSKFLEKSGIADSITTFLNPIEALEALRQMENWPDVLLLDIRMNEMDGFEFLENLERLPNEKVSKLNIYLVSSTLDSRDINRAKANIRVLDLISKPVNIQKLLDSFRNNNLI